MRAFYLLKRAPVTSAFGRYEVNGLKWLLQRNASLQEKVLIYSNNGASRNTVRRHYMRWRQEQEPPLPERCDNPECWFHTNPLRWNDKPLKPILDHKNGNNSDNRPKNLRFLCPNCDSQNTDTRGGANKGRIEKSEGGFARVDKDGKRSYIFPVEAGHYSFSGQEAQVSHRPKPSSDEDPGRLG